MTLKPDSAFLPNISLFIGLLTILPGAFTLALSKKAEAVWRAFPRSVWPGRIISAVCLVWSALWISAMPLGPLMIVRQYLWLLLPLSIAAVWFLIPDLLSCRAIGGLLVLLPAPMLSAAAWHPSAFRYVIIVYAYVMSIAGMFYIAIPWLLRDNLAWLYKKPRRAQVLAFFEVAFGAALIILSFHFRA